MAGLVRRRSCPLAEDLVTRKTSLIVAAVIWPVLSPRLVMSSDLELYPIFRHRIIQYLITIGTRYPSALDILLFIESVVFFIRVDPARWLIMLTLTL